MISDNLLIKENYHRKDDKNGDVNFRVEIYVLSILILDFVIVEVVDYSRDLLYLEEHLDYFLFEVVINSVVTWKKIWSVNVVTN